MSKSVITDSLLTDVAGAPWGATSATIHYDTTYDANGDPIE